jgi:hypothetical protein
MHDRLPLRRRVRITCRRVVPVAAVVLAAAVPGTRADAQAVPPLGPAVAPSVNVIGDSVIVTGQPYGRATIQVTRPDAMTGKPVVIGLFSGMANPNGPFSVNTTTPTALNPDGDCWQAGALSQALTPDIRPGDTVTVAGQPGLFGGSSSSTSVTVPANGPDVPRGPIPACRSVAPFAQNAVTAGPRSVSGAAIEVSGVSQPLATGVSSSVTDGARSTPPVDVAPNADGTWSAKVPAARVDALANGSLTVNPVFAVPDVSTGAPAHIVGGTISVQKTSAGQATGSGSRQPGTKSARPRVSRLRVQSWISLANARRDGLRATFVVPHGARVIGVRLLLGKRTVLRSVVPAAKAGTRQTVRLAGAALRVLHRGRYVLAVSAGPSRNRLGASVLRTISVR